MKRAIFFLSTLLAIPDAYCQDPPTTEASTWTLQGGELVYIKHTGDKWVIQDGRDKDIALLNPKEVVQQVALSPEKAVMLIRIEWLRTSSPRMRTFRYSRLLLLKSGSRGEREVATLLPYDRVPMNRLQRSVRDIKSVSEDGTSAILQIGEASNEGPGYGYSYYWAKVNLRTGDIVRVVGNEE